MNKVMVIAGGAWQAPLIKRIKDMGHHVLCANLYEDTPGIQLADEKVLIDVLDKHKNLEAAQRYKPDIVITDQSDIAVPTVAYVSEKLELPGIGMKMAELFTNKYAMREFEKINGFIHPGYYLCSEYEQAQAFLEKYGKGIIKPLNCQSSRGVFVLERGMEFKEKFLEAQTFTVGSNQVIIEEFIDGPEFTVDGIKLGEQYEVLAISEKKHYKHNESIASELYFTNINNHFDYEKLRSTNTELVKAMNLPFGLTHAEYKFHNGEFVLIEIAARGGGTRISSDIVPIMSGINSNELMVRYMLGENVKIPDRKPDQTCAILKFLETTGGRVKSIAGVNQITAMEQVAAFQLEFKVGDIIKEPDDDRTRAGFYIAYADTKAELKNICEKVEKALVIELEETKHE